MTTLIAKLKAWSTDQWNKHGTKIMGTMVTIAAGVLAVHTGAKAYDIDLGIPKKLLGACVAINVFLGPLIVKRSIGSPPKNPDPPT